MIVAVHCGIAFLLRVGAWNPLGHLNMQSAMLFKEGIHQKQLLNVM